MEKKESGRCSGSRSTNGYVTVTRGEVTTTAQNVEAELCSVGSGAGRWRQVGRVSNCHMAANGTPACRK